MNYARIYKLDAQKALDLDDHRIGKAFHKCDGRFLGKNLIARHNLAHVPSKTGGGEYRSSGESIFIGSAFLFLCWYEVVSWRKLCRTWAKAPGP